MGIMNTIRKMQESKKMKSEKFKQMQDDDKLTEMLYERKKSANERELEGYYEKLRESKIKSVLATIHKQQSKDSWSSGNPLKDKYMFKEKNPILKEKNIFLDNKSDIPFKKSSKGGGLFFK